MKKQTGIRYAVLAAFLAAFGVSGAALAVEEQEWNGVFSAPQKLTIGSDGSVTVNAIMGTLTGTVAARTAIADVDFFSFDGKEGDVVTIDIDGGDKLGATGTPSANGTPGKLDSIVALFGPCGALCFIQNDDVRSALPIDPGSISRLDARIEPFRLAVTGIYTVGVSSNGRPFDTNWRDGRTTSQTVGTNGNGSYTLIIAGVTPSMLQINIDIKPGHNDPVPLNPKSRGKVPVALMSSREFRALDVDQASLRWGATGDEASLSHCNKQGHDINRDGLPDLLCHFDNELANFDADDIEAVLRGKTKAGTMFEGRGSLKILPRAKE